MRSTLPSKLWLLIFKTYSTVFSPILHLVAGPGFGCRFEPSCSEYSRQALNTHGVIRGGRLALGRLCRCHPFAGASNTGYDPVPSCDIGVTHGT